MVTRNANSRTLGPKLPEVLTWVEPERGRKSEPAVAAPAFNLICTSMEAPSLVVMRNPVGNWGTPNSCHISPAAGEKTTTFTSILPTPSRAV